MDEFEAAAEEWDNVIEIVPTFAKGQEISEAIFLFLISYKKPILFSWFLPMGQREKNVFFNYMYLNEYKIGLYFLVWPILEARAEIRKKR